MGFDPIFRTPSAYSNPLLIKNLLFAPAAWRPEREIVYRGEVRHTYRTFRERVQRLANVLVSLGVKPGDTVAVMDYDSHRYLECFYAVPMIGAVLHTINVRLSPEQILFTIDHAEDDVLLVHSDFLPVLSQIRGRIGTVRSFVLLSDDGAVPAGAPVPFAGEYEALLAAAPPSFDFPDFDENARATTFYTTGTTGLPKGVYFSHRQLVLHTLGVASTIASAPGNGRFHQGDVYMPLTPMFHVHAWGVPYVATLFGVKQVYPGKYVPDALLRLVRDEGVTFSHCVPTILHMLLKSPLSREVDLSRWKVIIGGAAMPRSLCVEALERGIDVFTGYGMSETCPILTLSLLEGDDLAKPPEEQAAKRCRTGAPIAMVRLRVAGEDGSDAAADDAAPGEVLVRAPWLTQGYLKDHVTSERLWEGGWLHTNDVAAVDGRGSLRITDRKKDVIKVGGEWVSSLEIEDIVARHPAVAEVAVIGEPDDQWGERPLALVVRREGHDGTVTEQAVAHHVKEYADRGALPREAVLTRARFVDAIDRTSVGKINKVALREKHLPPRK